MGKYVDGFVIPVPKDKIDAYRAIAEKARDVWMDHGAVQYVEAIGDDLDSEMGVSFTKIVGAKSDETVVFAWITYTSRAHRDEVNKKVMEDPRMKDMPQDMPFDCQRMTYGGFRAIVENV